MVKQSVKSAGGEETWPVKKFQCALRIVTHHKTLSEGLVSNNMKANWPPQIATK